MSTVLDKALINVVKGISTLEEFVERVVHGAVSESIDTLADAYGLDHQKLRTTVLPPIVQKYSKIVPGENTCKAITYRGKRCTQDTFGREYCQLHTKQRNTRHKPSTTSTSGVQAPAGQDTSSLVMHILTSRS